MYERSPPVVHDTVLLLYSNWPHVISYCITVCGDRLHLQAVHLNLKRNGVCLLLHDSIECLTAHVCQQRCWR
jgi:hypothetical protein